MATHRAEWEKIVEDQLKEGAKRFVDLSTKLDANTKLTKELKDDVEENTNATLLISNKLDSHVESYEKFRANVQPALNAIMTMQSGVRVLGKIGDFITWVANRVRRGIIWMAPLVAFAISVWGFFHDKPAEMWQMVVDWWAK